MSLDACTEATHAPCCPLPSDAQTTPLRSYMPPENMTLADFPSRVPARYWGYLALLFWGVVTLFLLRQDPYGLDEGGAKSLLLTWSIADQVASSVVTFSAPDLRVLFFLPAGFLWTGNVFAAKVFTVMALALTAWLLYFWKRRNTDAECALLATGLLLISPLTLEQIDTLSPGIYLLLAFALGGWLDQTYRANPNSFGGWYFAQLFVCAFAVSLHPAGLAYPLALLWAWRTEPLDRKQQQYFFIGIGLVVLFTLAIRMGWNDLTWFQNPVKSLGSILLGSPLDDGISVMRWIAGGTIAGTLVITIVKQFPQLWSDLNGRTLLIGLVLGITSGDQAWGMIALSIILYFGFPLLLRPPKSVRSGFWQQRGAAFLLVFIISTFFMQADRAHYESKVNGALTANDQLIRTLADEAEAARKAAEDNDGARNHFRVASQWPSRTMIACKCDTLPLPPAAKDPQTQLGMLRSITHLVLDPKQLNNEQLAQNIAMLGEVIETTSLQPGGVILHVKERSETAIAPQAK